MFKHWFLTAHFPFCVGTGSTGCGYMSPGSPFDNISNNSNGVNNGNYSYWAFLRYLLVLTDFNSLDPPISPRRWVMGLIPILQISKPRFGQAKEHALSHRASEWWIQDLSHSCSDTSTWILDHIAPWPLEARGQQDSVTLDSHWKFIPTPTVGPWQFT